MKFAQVFFWFAVIDATLVRKRVRSLKKTVRQDDRLKTETDRNGRLSLPPVDRVRLHKTLRSWSALKGYVQASTRAMSVADLHDSSRDELSKPIFGEGPAHVNYNGRIFLHPFQSIHLNSISLFPNELLGSGAESNVWSCAVIQNARRTSPVPFYLFGTSWWHCTSVSMQNQTPFPIRYPPYVAVKIYKRRSHAADELRMETKILLKSRHRSIPNCYASFTDPHNVSYCVMTRVQGQDLVDCKDPFLLSQQGFCQIAWQLLDALDYLHSTIKVAHRDLKPENIVYNPQTRTVYLIDFSLAASLVDLEFGDACLDASGSVQYMSPESLQFLVLRRIPSHPLHPQNLKKIKKQPIMLKRYNEKVDIWALGITLIAIYTQTSPYCNRRVSRFVPQLMLNGLTDPFPDDLSQITGSVQWTPLMKDFVMKILVFDPVHRPSARSLKYHPLFSTYSHV